MPNPVPATDPGLPAIPDTPVSRLGFVAEALGVPLPPKGPADLLTAERLHEIHDALVLALDATEQPNGYTASEREAREHIRVALRHTIKLQEGRA